MAEPESPPMQQDEVLAEGEIELLYKVEKAPCPACGCRATRYYRTADEETTEIDRETYYAKGGA